MTQISVFFNSRYKSRDDNVNNINDSIYHNNDIANDNSTDSNKVEADDSNNNNIGKSDYSK